MNVLILSLAFAPYSGVGTARMTSLTRRLIEGGNKVTVACYNSKIYGANEQTREIPRGISLIILDKANQKWKNIRNLEEQIEQIVKKEKFDICISSVGPFDTMFFIFKMKKKWGVPYIIDYRDPWLFEKSIIEIKGISKFRKWMRESVLYFLEKEDIKWAEKVVLVSEQGKQDLREKYHLPDSKCEVIFNGYEYIPEKIEIEKREGLTLAIAGKFSYYYKEAVEFFMKVCCQENEHNPIRVIHIGEYETKLAQCYSEIYVGLGMKTYDDTMKYLMHADVLVVVYAFKSGLGTKVFDYIALNKPIIYVGIVPSELAEFVAQFENAFICKDESEVKKAINELLCRKPKELTKECDLKKFSRDFQNEVYYSLLEEIVIRNINI